MVYKLNALEVIHALFYLGILAFDLFKKAQAKTCC